VTAMVSYQVPVDHIGELALERAAGLLGGLGLAQLALVVDLSWAGVADLAYRDDVQGSVALPVASPVQTSHVLVSQAARLLRWPQARCSL
jgi:hypothetical protein